MVLENFKDKKAQELFEEGLEYLQKNSYSQALQRLDLAESKLSVKKDFFSLRYVQLEKVKALRGLQEFQAARKLVQSLIEQFVLYDQHYLLLLSLIELAEIDEDSQAYQPALENLNYALEIAKAHGFSDLFPYIFSKLAVNYAREGFTNESIFFFRSCLSVQPQAYHRAWILKRLGDLFRSIFAYQDATLHYTQAQEIFLQHKDYDFVTQCMENLLPIYWETGQRLQYEETRRKMVEIQQTRIVRPET